MNMTLLLQLAVLLPLGTVAAISLCARSKERLISRIASLSAVACFVNQIALGLMFVGRKEAWEIHLPFYDHHFAFGFYADKLALVFGSLTALFCLIIVRFSRAYMHREPGFRRFFAMIFLLAAGMQILALADNLQTFFIGWELIGVASFVLIAFYREQKNSVKNALKVFAVYRIGDLGLLFGMLAFHLSGATNGFSSLTPGLSGHHADSTLLLYISVCGIIVAAMAKSAQFPFSFWLPRAMEGPTPSSAIFYGALSVHAGVILLAKMQPVWQTVPGIPFALVVIGLLTAILAEGASRTHPSIKGRLAMSSVTQVGLIFAELGFGLNALAIWHTVAHALLRSGQILISPSIISHLLRMKSAGLKAPYAGARSIEKLLPARFRSTLWVLAFQDHLIEHQLTRLHYFIRSSMARRNLPYIGAYAVSFIAATVMMAPSTKLQFFASFSIVAGLLSAAALTAVVPYRMRIALVAGSVFLSETVLAGFGSLNREQAMVMFVTTACLFGLMLTSAPPSTRSANEPDFIGLWSQSPLRSGLIFLSAAMLAGIPPSPLFFFEDLAWSQLISSSIPVAFALAFLHALNGIALFKAAAYLTMGPPAQSLSVATKSEAAATRRLRRTSRAS